MRSKRAKAIRKTVVYLAKKFGLPPSPINPFNNFYRKMKRNWVHRNG